MPSLGANRLGRFDPRGAASVRKRGGSSAMRSPRLAAASAKGVVSRLSGRAHRERSVAWGPSAVAADLKLTHPAD